MDKHNVHLNYYVKDGDKMDFHTFQGMSERTMPNGGIMIDGKIFYSGHNVANYSMGLAGEAGELVDYIKKVLFHGHEFDRDKFVKEGGDVLHYLAGLCTMYDVTLEELATENLVKLQKRYPNGFSHEASKARKDMEERGEI